MTRTTSGFLVLLGLSAAGCGALDKGKLDPRVASQVVVSRLDPPVGCTYRGRIKGSAPLGELPDAHADVLRHAVLQGGNYVAVDLVERPVIIGIGSYEVHGRLFTCPAQGAPPAAMTAPPSAPVAMAPVAPVAPSPNLPRACDPECAAGFSCQLGACVAPPSVQAAAPN